MKVLIFDNYDSFTYNLVHIVLQFPNVNLDVFRNDQISLEEVSKYDKILLSPGPGLPIAAGNLLEVIHQYSANKSILGVCLGLQGIAEAFGGKLKNLDKVMHGVAEPTIIKDRQEVLFKNLPERFFSGRYHSWVVDREFLPDCFKITAVDENGNIMALRHQHYDVRGVQFHPESILTENGNIIIKNWLKN